MNTIYCAWCGGKFTPTHGNNKYCCDEHEDEARKLRQKNDRDPTARFLPILRDNHRIIAALVRAGKTELTKSEMDAYQIDISLCRHLQPPPEHEGKLLLDFGHYFLITESDFLTFKIYKHEQDTTTTV